MQNELDSKYNNKLIYAFYGLGKTKAKSLNKSLYETDDLLCKMFRCKNNTLYNKMTQTQKLFPDVYDYTMENLGSTVDSILKKGGTVLTSNDRLISKSNYIFLPSNLDKTISDLKSNKRFNPFVADKSKLETKLKRIKTIAKNNSIPIIEVDSYLSNYILK